MHKKQVSLSGLSVPAALLPDKDEGMKNEDGESFGDRILTPGWSVTLYLL